jgi:alkanesulfonate monooxygenase SsuD/methylene tetrahydromethanopterin reductase-like flavin-dependent oxidoreductase (luciferase family)
VRYSIFSVVDNDAAGPRSTPAFYQQLLREMERAEALGFWGYFVAEHHFHEYGVVPSPPVLLAVAAERTSRLRLGTAVATLPFHDPVRVAEDYAMLDVLSGGRLALGVGSGYLAHEFDGFGVGPWEKRARFDEALVVLEAAWSGERFTHHGRYFHYQDVAINVQPLQRPVPLWVAILNTEAAYHLGRRGRDLMLIPYASFSDLGKFAGVSDAYRRGRAEAGEVEVNPDGGDLNLAFHTYVAESDARAVAEARPALDRYIETRLYARRRTLEELDATGLVLIGSPETVACRVAAAVRAGMTQLMILTNFGGLDETLVDRSTTLFAEEVVPRVERLLSRDVQPVPGD